LVLLRILDRLEEILISALMAAATILIFISVVHRLNPRWQKGVILFGLLGGALFTVIVGTMGAKFVIELMSTDQVSPDLELPSWLVYACIPLGSYLMCFRFLQVAWTYFWTGNLPHHDATHVDGVEVSSKAPIALGEA
jgi:C4-dicarboxylate transporter, DctQ subunit